MPVTDRPYLPAIETLKLCHAALGRPMAPEERRIVLALHRQAFLQLEQLVRNDEARVQRINQFNAQKQLAPEQVSAEKAHVGELQEVYRANIKGRFSREGCSRWIVAKSGIPKKRTDRYLKELSIDRGVPLSAAAPPNAEGFPS